MGGNPKPWFGPIGWFVSKWVNRCIHAIRPSREQPEIEFFRAVCEIGKDSPNPWIRKSAEIPGWLFDDEHEFLWDLATRSTTGDVLEIGTWMGKSACILAGACREHAPGTKVFCVDTFEMLGTDEQEEYHKQLVRGERGTFYQFLSNARQCGFFDVVVPLATLSARILPHLDGEFRLAFVDGTHDYANAKNDVELCLPLLRTGGVLALHDVTNKAFPGLLEYVTEELRQDARLKEIGENGTIVAFEKVPDMKR